MNLRDFHLLACGASIALSAAIVIQALVDRRIDRRLRWLMALVAISGGAYTLLLAPPGDGWSPLARTPLRMVAAAGVVMLWLAIQVVFRDGFRLRVWHPGLAVAVMLAAALPVAGDPAAGAPLRQAGAAAVTAIAIACVLHAVWIVAGGWRADLDDRRRLLRLLLTVAACGVVLAGVGRRFLPAAGWSDDVGGALLAGALVSIKLGWLALTVGERPVITTVLAPAAPEPPLDRALAATAGAASGTAEDAQRVLAAMEQDRLYRQPRLAVRDLARHVDVPEYRVRQAIIEQLGYRNFTAFVGRFRLQEVAQRLGDPLHREASITTLALDAGFASLGPFNRAFRAAFGVTPLQYRGAAGSTPADATNLSPIR